MYLSGLDGPTFYDVGHNPINSVMCGQPYSFDVPGYGPQVWLEQVRNGIPGYNGPLSIPMNPYTANCTTEVGNYWNTVYAMQNGQKGQMIGQVSFNVLPMATQPIVQAPTPGQGGTFSPTSTPTSGFTTSGGAPAGGTTIYAGGGGVPGDVSSGGPPGIMGPPPPAGGGDALLLIPLGIAALIFFAGRGSRKG